MSRRRFSQICWVLLALAAVQIGRAAISQNYSLISLAQYAHLQAPDPFQGRILMAPVLRFAESNRTFLKAFAVLGKAIRSPEEMALQIINALCLLAMLPLTAALRRRFLPATGLSWLGPLVMLWVVGMTYVIRYEQRFFMPYDFLSLLLFTIGLLAILDGRGWLLLVVMAIATPNRETSVFLLPVWLIDQWADGKRGKALVYTALGLGIFLAWKLEIARVLGRYGTGYESHLISNLISIVDPRHFTQTFSVAGYLALPMWLLRRHITDSRLKRMWLGLIPFLLAAIVSGIWKETRIFFEVSALVGVTAAIEIESAARTAILTEGEPDPHFSN